MPWQDLIDQTRTAEALRRAVTSGRVAHAYLFHGPDGVGKRAVALALAQALQCERQAADGDACGRCLACTKVARLIHPDVHVLLPAPSDADTAEVAERIRLLAEDPYQPIDFVRRPSLDDPSKTSNKQAFYAVGRVHEELRRAMGFKPVEGRYKIAIVTDADAMRAEAANAFLKLLEEPGPRTVFVLTTSRPDRLLPTITSRCQRLRFEPLPAEAIEAALVERAGVNPGQAAALARMADGSYTRALDLAGNEDLVQNRALVLDYFRQAYTGHMGRQIDLAERLAGLGRERVKAVLALMLRWLRDLVLVRTLGPEAPLVNVDHQDAARRFAENVPEADLEAMARHVEEAIELAERNVRLDLVLMTLAHTLGRAMQGAPTDALYTPLVNT